MIMSIRNRLTVAVLLLLCAACGPLASFGDTSRDSLDALDERIVAEISTRFLKSKEITYLDIQPRSYAGHVYLIGEAGSPAEIDAAVDIAKGVEGVRSVTTYVIPKPEQPVCSSLDNASIESRVWTAFGDLDGTAAQDVDLTVFQCRVVLTGYIKGRDAEAALISKAQAVDGVIAVKSLLRKARK